MNLRVIGHDSWKTLAKHAGCCVMAAVLAEMHRHNFLAYIEQPGLPLGSPKIDGYPHKKLVQFQCFASIKSQFFNLLSVQLNARLTENGRARGGKYGQSAYWQGIHRVCRLAHKRPKSAIAAQFPAYANATRQTERTPFGNFQRLASKCVIYQQNLLHLCCMQIFAKPLDPSAKSGLIRIS